MATLSDLDILIPQYAENKREFDAYKKICDGENQKIKDIMEGLALQHYSASGYKVTRSVSERESINEKMLLEIAHQHGISEIVKTKEYIDFDELERAIYNNKIPNDILIEMDKAREIKTVVTLKLSKIKEKK